MTPAHFDKALIHLMEVYLAISVEILHFWWFNFDKVVYQH